MSACASAAQHSLGGGLHRQISYILFQAYFINNVGCCEGNRTKVDSGDIAAGGVTQGCHRAPERLSVWYYWVCVTA
jgi:hypothetical protein